jgi:1,4-dihydroxy-2-naphthoyl-CoA hydrolase
MSDSEASGGSRQQLTHKPMVDLMPFASTIGVELVSAAPERVEGRLAYSPERCTSGGVLHGGTLMAMADSFGGVCTCLNLAPGATTSTIESKTNFFRAVREG